MGTIGRDGSESQGAVPGARHLTFGNLDMYWAAAVAVEIPVPGDPACRVRLDPQHDQMSLLVPLQGDEPSLANFRNIEFFVFVEDDQSWAELRINVAGSLHGGFGILVSVADRVQIARQTLAIAIPGAIAEHRDVFATESGLSPEREIGLYGELLLLETLLSDGHAENAVAVWVGPLSAEHDFVFPASTVEVKTTSGERRRHVIGNLGQLKPLPGVPLWLASVQITSGSTAVGRTLARLVDDVRRKCGGELEALEVRLRAAGWRDADRALFTTNWALRSTPRCYRVDEAFPALTDERLAHAVPQASLLSDVTYRLDVTDLLHDESGPEPLAKFLTGADK